MNFNETEYKAIEFHNGLHERIRISPMYFKLGFSPRPAIYGREAVLTRLMAALNELPETYGFLIWDVYRPREVQTTLFKWMREEIRKKYPDLNEEENEKEAKKYMSAPSKIGDAYCPPHLSGGAIDLTLFDTNTQKELNMGTVFDDCSERAHRDYFTKLNSLSQEEQNIHENRTLLQSVMEKVGFTSYSFEWWHFDIGNMFWGQTLNQKPVFGPLFGDEEWPHQI